MPNKMQRTRMMERQDEIAAIGAADSKKLHKGMNKSAAGAEKRAHKQPDKTNRMAGPAMSANTSTSGSKRHASAGAGPSEPTATTAKRTMKRATVKQEMSPTERGKKTTSATRRNDAKTTTNPKPMRTSAKRTTSPKSGAR